MGKGGSMFLDRKQIKENAKDALKANYWPMILYSAGIPLVLSIVCLILTKLGLGLISTIVSALISPVLTIGLCNVCYRVYKGEEHSVSDIIDGFQNFGHIIGGYWWMMLWIFLWSLLLYIPGIVKAYAYSMTPYILADQPEIEAQEALKVSMEMTNGHKGKLFVLSLSFIGWAIVAGFTAGIAGIFWVIPYMNLTMAGYYAELKENFNN